MTGGRNTARSSLLLFRVHVFVYLMCLLVFVYLIRVLLFVFAIELVLS